MPALVQLAQVLPDVGGRGPSGLVTASFVLLPIGFGIGVLGHLTGIRALVAAGVAIVFVASGFFVIAVGQSG